MKQDRKYELPQFCEISRWQMKVMNLQNINMLYNIYKYDKIR